MMLPTVIPDEATLRRAPESAVRAPSVCNSHRWCWRTSTTDGVDLFADPDRHLMAIDLDERDLLLSCGAASSLAAAALARAIPRRRTDRRRFRANPVELDLAQQHAVTTSRSSSMT